MKCGICGTELNRPMAPETMDCGGDCARCMAGFGDSGCIRLLKNLGDPTKRAEVIASYEAWRVKQV